MKGGIVCGIKSGHAGVALHLCAFGQRPAISHTSTRRDVVGPGCPSRRREREGSGGKSERPMLCSGAVLEHGMAEHIVHKIPVLLMVKQLVPPGTKNTE